MALNDPGPASSESRLALGGVRFVCSWCHLNLKSPLLSLDIDFDLRDTKLCVAALIVRSGDGVVATAVAVDATENTLDHSMSSAQQHSTPRPIPACPHSSLSGQQLLPSLV
jgi:hypothetical protein